VSWETRRGRGRYYTRSRRAGGRIVRQYVGTGPVAELAAAADALRREGRRARAAALQAERARWEAARAALRRFAAGADLLTRAALLAAGYHQHDRGAWRRRRDRHPPTTTPDPRPAGP
jgi:hypothetical protein